MGEGWELMQTPNSWAEYVHTGVPHPHHFCIAPHVHSMLFPIQDSFLIKQEEKNSPTSQTPYSNFHPPGEI